jgi:hypothetical protein
MTADPAAGLMVAAPGGGYEPLASSDMAAALTAGGAALIRSRYPWLTVAEVTQAIERGATPPPGGANRAASAGRGHGELDAAAALTAAAAIAAAHPAPAPSTPHATPPAAAGRAATHRAAAGQSDPGGLLRSLVVGLAVAAGVLIACLIAAITLTRFRRRARAAKAGGAATAGRRPRIAGRARHARGQQAVRTAPVPARVVIWPSTPALPASGTAGAFKAPAALGKHGGAYRRQRPTGNPPWQPATPPGNTASPPKMLPAQPAGAPAEKPLAPWEESPAEFATAPVMDDPARWPLSTTGPMYVWNPAATGPTPAARDDE